MSVDLNNLSFDDLEPRSLVVMLKQVPHLLVEPSESDVCRWRNAQIREAKMVNGKVAGIGNVADTEPLLVHYCLFQILKPELVEVDGETGNRAYNGPRDGNHIRQVPLATIRGWTGRLVGKLFEAVKELGELNDKESPERKALLAALAREDAPTNLHTIREWVEGLVGEDSDTYTPLKALLAPTAEETAKNGQVATPAI